MTYREWLATVPEEFTSDPLWRTEVYRQALFLGELAWHDACKLAKNRVTLEVSDQLYRSAGKISANIAEGYSRASGKDQARFYEYGLGSAREARDWYYKGRYVLGDIVFTHRIGLLTEIAKQLSKIVPKYRGLTISEERPEYIVSSPFDSLNDAPFTPAESLPDESNDSL